MGALNGEQVGSPTKDLVLVTGNKVYIRRGDKFYEIDLLKLEKLMEFANTL